MFLRAASARVVATYGDLLHCLRATSAAEAPEIHILSIGEELFPRQLARRLRIQLVDFLDFFLDLRILMVGLVHVAHDDTSIFFFAVLEQPTRRLLHD